MNWHYVENGQQRGPVTEEDLAALAAQGVVTAETLVWREGLDKWLPYNEVKPAAGATAAAPAAPPGQVICCECGRPFAPDDVVRHGDMYVCGACKPIFLQKLHEGVLRPVAMNYAGFWIRAGAKILDMLIVGVPVQLISVLMLSGATPGRRAGLPLLNFGLGFLINGSYNVFFLGRYGATPGKMAAKLRVLNADGSPISYGLAAGRFLAELLSGMICYIGYMMAGWDDEKRALHDRICNTRVIRK
jgi:uncharacterized RDD family membrane protein YckC